VLKLASLRPALFCVATASLLAESPAQPEVFEPNVISTADDESHPHFTSDGKTLYFLKNTADFNHWTIVVSHEQNGKWSTPEVAPFSGQYSDADPFITADGERFFLISMRPVNGKPKEHTDIWMMKKSGADWAEPEHLAAVNSETNEWFPTVSNNGNLYFGSERAGGKGKCDIYCSKRVDGKYGAPENLGEPINSGATKLSPSLRPTRAI
jgi:WD40-like Beta Propeller Repeat